jgi:hypothetical protein
MRWLLPLLVLTIVAAGCGSGDSTPTPIGAVPSPQLTAPTQTSGPRIASPTPAEFPFSTPPDTTPRAGVPTGIHAPDGQGAVDIPADAAVYLSLGDSINFGCCADPNLSSHPLFAQYLSQQLNRPVVWVSLAGGGTLQDFLHAGSPTQLERAEELLGQWRTEGRGVVAIALSIGGNDLLVLRTNGCTGGGGNCETLFQQMLDTYQHDMLGVYERLNAAKDPSTPILQNNIYDAMNCGRPGDEISSSSVAVRVFNERVKSATIAGGSFLMDFYEPFHARACELVSGVDPTYQGYDEIYKVDVQTYQSLPAQYTDPWRK